MENRIVIRSQSRKNHFQNNQLSDSTSRSREENVKRLNKNSFFDLNHQTSNRVFELLNQNPESTDSEDQILHSSFLNLSMNDDYQTLEENEFENVTRNQSVSNNGGEEEGNNKEEEDKIDSSDEEDEASDGEVFDNHVEEEKKMIQVMKKKMKKR
ncbi:hypothetical protein BpHYR1_032528 [Brachionus plicatilis]|uniref:Uncharacterized protein n=1 Tax=Brachionus plicatilis TaxID=10195 RepID=A0A3M7RD73_BRAPC|nr:hypothetical protein BpHYR1_032528 [Brachionus plicatilis]